MERGWYKYNILWTLGFPEVHKLYDWNTGLGVKMGLATQIILASATQDKMHPFLIIKSSQFVQLVMLLLWRKRFYASSDKSVQKEIHSCEQEMILCSWKHFLRVWTDLCDRKYSFAAGNDFMQVWTDCVTWNALRQLGVTLYKFGQICETGNALIPLETILCEYGRICATGNGLVQLEPNLCNSLLAGTPFLIFRPKFEQKWASPSILWADDSSHSQGQFGKRVLQAFRGHPIRTASYQGSYIDPSYLSHTIDSTPDTPGA